MFTSGCTVPRSCNRIHSTITFWVWGVFTVACSRSQACKVGGDSITLSVEQIVSTYFSLSMSYVQVSPCQQCPIYWSLFNVWTMFLSFQSLFYDCLTRGCNLTSIRLQVHARVLCAYLVAMSINDASLAMPYVKASVAEPMTYRNISIPAVQHFLFSRNIG